MSNVKRTKPTTPLVTALVLGLFLGIALTITTLLVEEVSWVVGLAYLFIQLQLYALMLALGTVLGRQQNQNFSLHLLLGAAGEKARHARGN